MLLTEAKMEEKNITEKVQYLQYILIQHILYNSTRLILPAEKIYQLRSSKMHVSTFLND